MLAQVGRVEEAEKEYRSLFEALPRWHFGRYRYPPYLADNGRKEEAVATLLELVASKAKIDGETYRAASEVLRDLERG